MSNILRVSTDRHPKKSAAIGAIVAALTLSGCNNNGSPDIVAICDDPRPVVVPDGVGYNELMNRLTDFQGKVSPEVIDKIMKAVRLALQNGKLPDTTKVMRDTRYNNTPTDLIAGSTVSVYNTCKIVPL